MKIINNSLRNTYITEKETPLLVYLDAYRTTEDIYGL